MTLSTRDSHLQPESRQDHRPNNNSDLHTKAGTAPSATGAPITNIKLPHVGGHEGVGRVAALGPDVASNITLNTLVGIRFLSTTCHACEYCVAGLDQYCQSATNHLHHEDGSFQQYCLLRSGKEAEDFVVLRNVDESDTELLKVLGPTLCAGVTAYKAVKNSGIKRGEWLTVVGAGGGLGHFAVQYALALGARVIGIDAGPHKHDFITSLGASHYIDITQTPNIASEVHRLTNGGTHALIVTSGHPSAFTKLADMIRTGGALCMVGIPPGEVKLDMPVSEIIIRGLRIQGNLVGSLAETMEAVELVRQGKVKPRVQVLPFRDLERAYELLESGKVMGRIVLQM
jgi:alcohol dehydrogenase, propanol-preferring